MPGIAAPNPPGPHCPTCRCYRARARSLLWAEAILYAVAVPVATLVAIALRAW